MGEAVRAADLLARAAAHYDAPGSRLRHHARTAWRGGFAGGASWMALALGELRGVGPLTAPRRGNALGLVKYGAAALAGIATIAAAIAAGAWPLSAAGVLSFYIVEAQMVFAFPLAADGAPRPLRAAPAWTRRAGGTLRVVRVVLPLAWEMLFGGFAGRGFLRSWCLGCLAVVIWYERLLRERSARAHSPPPGRALAGPPLQGLGRGAAAILPIDDDCQRGVTECEI